MDQHVNEGAQPPSYFLTITAWAHRLGVSRRMLRAFFITKAVAIDAQDRCHEAEVRTALRIPPDEPIRPKRWSGYYAYQHSAFMGATAWEGALRLKRGTLLPALQAAGAIPVSFTPRIAPTFFTEDDVVRTVTTTLGKTYPVIPEGDRLFYGATGYLHGTWEAWENATHEVATASAIYGGAIMTRRGRLSVTNGALPRFVWIHTERAIRALVRELL